MKELRRGNDGSIEKDDNGDYKTLKDGDTTWVSIEPSSKVFRFDDGSWGAAAYPKSVEDAKKHWRRLSRSEIVEVTTRITASGMVIPYQQIAATYVSLHGGDLAKVEAQLREGLAAGKPSLGLRHVRVMGPKSVAIGIINSKTSSLGEFPASYHGVPMKKGTLILVKLSWDDWVRNGKAVLDTSEAKYKADGVKYVAPALIYPIDAPAVKAALWAPALDQVTRASITELLEEARRAVHGSKPLASA